MARYKRQESEEDDLSDGELIQMDEVRSLLKRTGRRSNCTPELTLEICALVCNGASIAAAASSVGIIPQKLWQWLRWGRQEYDVIPETEPLTKFALFYVAVMSAMGVARASAEQRVWNEKPEIWLTKGGLSGNWADTVELRIPGTDDRPQVESPIMRLPDTQLEQVLNILQEVGAFEAAVHAPDLNTVEAD